ncbi:MAG TPA: dTDP-glucose 4,6-dehydratase [Candidatus Polarisedimenticolaceae bacterium]|nr:dTDP-glucose 4,6-dehydratase [Candidatus Polarisedimenticolaceae bacterium]
MPTWLVTGGAGFIGANLVRRILADTGARVVVLDKLTYAGNLESLAEVRDDPRFTFLQGDIADRETVARVFREHVPDAVLNLAAESHVDRSIDGPRPFLLTNTVGAFELLEASRRLLAADPARARTFRFLHVSTDEVFGSLGETGRFSETTPYAPNSPYAATKAAADHLVRAYHATFGLPTLVTNCSNNFGPFQFPEKLVPLLLLNALEGKDLPVYGDGGNVRDWLYVEDHCAGILRVLDAGRPGQSYNLGGGNEKTNLQMVEALCEALEREVPAAANPALRAGGIARYRDLVRLVPDRPGHDRRYAIDAGKARAELAWEPAQGFQDALQRTVRWYLAHRDWCAAVQAGTYERERLGLGIVES